ncbi:MAG: hypothetical protein AB1512_06075 [Thermodesulfobacteriota bacterium]
MQKKPRIMVYITAPRKGLYLSMAKLLSSRHEVWILARDEGVRDVALDRLPEMAERVILRPSADSHLGAIDVVTESLAREEKYGERFSMIMSHDRALGQGYFFNADRHPHIHRSLWPRDRKLGEILREFLCYEQVMEVYSPEVILADSRPLAFDLIARYHQRPYLSPVTARISDWYYWAENRFDTNDRLLERIRWYSGQLQPSKQEESIEYEEYEKHRTSLQMMDFSFWRAIKDSAYLLTRDTYSVIRGLRKKNSYIFGAWIKPALRRALSYRFFQEHGQTIESLRSEKIVYFALHMEPEAALMRLAPEFNNSEEIISWVSRSLPADHYLVVKENPWSFGVRSMDYYRRLTKIGNVLLAHPETSSQEWIKLCRAVVCISGTVGFEAIYASRPVLCFGEHNPIQFLPTVKSSDSFRSTREALQSCLTMDPNSDLFTISKRALHYALKDVSFQIPGLGSMLRSSDLRLDLAEEAVLKLYSEYPHVFGNL